MPFEIERAHGYPVLLADAPLHRREKSPFRLSTTSRSITLYAQRLLLLFTIIRQKKQKGKRFKNIFFILSQNKRMGLIIIRTAILFLTLFSVMRLMGKRQIGEMQPYELVITLIISELACIPMSDTSIPLLYGIVSILTVYLLHQIVCLIDLQVKGAKSVLSGTPSIVLNKNGIDDSQLKKNHLDVTDLIESLRAEGFFSLDGVEYALYEAEGTFSALPKQNYQELQTSLPVVLVQEGKFNESNLKLTKLSKEYYRSILKKNGAKDEKRTLILTVDGNGKVYWQEKDKKYKVLQLDWKEQLW